MAPIRLSGPDQVVSLTPAVAAARATRAETVVIAGGVVGPVIMHQVAHLADGLAQPAQRKQAVCQVRPSAVMVEPARIGLLHVGQRWLGVITDGLQKSALQVQVLIG